ncbi:hypothetical protein BU16DRAFT_621803 [Lophium mytilinum]|uniref:Uncharacterized protein n=1 Tax=Lophium mytilinum TaxID=390894 RepID=A0A6A6QFI0_9PEZI|nr:hypothetical protein BU16DRAFT_621803 [Lophium mytilinum]
MQLTALMAGGFGFSISDLAAIGTFAWNLYKSCKNAGSEFQVVTGDVNTLQTALRELNDEDCDTDLRTLERLLTKYGSLKSSNPRTRDKMGFSPTKVHEIRVKLSKHTEKLNFFLTQMNTSALGRMETKLDMLREDILRGWKKTSMFGIAEDLTMLEKELLDDEITEVDVELNRGPIMEWLRPTREAEHFLDIPPVDLRTPDPPIVMESPIKMSPCPSVVFGTKETSKNYQATVDDGSDDGEAYVAKDLHPAEAVHTETFKQSAHIVENPPTNGLQDENEKLDAGRKTSLASSVIDESTFDKTSDPTRVLEEFFNLPRSEPRQPDPPTRPAEKQTNGTPSEGNRSPPALATRKT